MSKQLSLNEKAVSAENPYDAVPYSNMPNKISSPGQMKTVATVFGVNSPSLETASVLELGCASGENLFPFAANYPNAKIVGVDYSSKQIEAAKKQAKELGLKNIEFKCMSFADIDKKFGKFDYIIAHGVFSWVTPELQDKLIEICSQNLTAEGLAYISYNTLPGWNMIKSLREMMLYHIQGFATPQEKVNQAKLLLEFVLESVKGSDSAYEKVIASELSLLSSTNAAYFAHDHLEDQNNPVYFHEFMQKAFKNKLQFLGEARVSSMYVGNLPAKAQEKLAEITDIYRMEQYKDFITNRRFRETILCHQDVKINRSIEPKDINKFAMVLNVRAPQPLSVVNLNDAAELEFAGANNPNIKVRTTSPEMKAVLYTFSENLNHPLTLDQLVDKAHDKLPSADKAAIRANIEMQAMAFALQGILEITVEKPKFQIEIKEKPEVSKLARYQAENSAHTWITNSFHTPVVVSNIEKLVIRYLDGQRTRSQIEEEVLSFMKNNDLKFSTDQGEITDEKVIKDAVSKFVEATIGKMAVNSALI